MKFPNKYPFLQKNEFLYREYSIIPIRYKDRLDIMKWRNEQIYHLRQKERLTKEKQDKYYSEVVSKIFEQKEPEQILFSYLKNGDCIGYGGLVHINWIDKNAEISFIMNTDLEEKEFELHWITYLALIEQVAFEELGFNKIYTYAFDLRPHLYSAVEKAGFTKEAVLREHCLFKGAFKDVLIHSKYRNNLSIRPILITDLDFTYLLFNDLLIRSNSYNKDFITYSEHKKWFLGKLDDKNAFYYIGELNRQAAVFLRVDIGSEENIIGIAIDKQFRGKKLAVEFLRLITEKFSDEYSGEITAYIKVDNIPSIKSFERAGFVFEGNCIIEGEQSVRYIYEQ